MVADSLRIHEYHQPSFYHFNEDSLLLSQFIRERMTITEDTALCEFGAGCGVISFEIARKSQVGTLHLVEAQREFKDFLEVNRKTYQLSQVEFSIEDIKNFKSSRLFDGLYFNPPYFFEDSSRPSGNLNREKCRRIKREAFEDWFIKAHELLKKDGDLFFCFREDISIPADFRLVCQRETNGAILFHYKSY